MKKKELEEVIRETDKEIQSHIDCAHENIADTVNEYWYEYYSGQDDKVLANKMRELMKETSEGICQIEQLRMVKCKLKRWEL